jgi:hypothetical protein
LVNAAFRTCNGVIDFLVLGLPNNSTSPYIQLLVTREELNKAVLTSDQAIDKKIEVAMKELDPYLLPNSNKGLKYLSGGFLKLFLHSISNSCQCDIKLSWKSIFQEKMENSITTGEQHWSVSGLVAPVTEPFQKLNALEQTKGKLGIVYFILFIYFYRGINEFMNSVHANFTN